MKTLLSIFLFVAAATQSLLAQTTTVLITEVGTQTIQVPAGQVFQLQGIAITTGIFAITVNGVNIMSAAIPIAGPNTVSIGATTGGATPSGVITYKLSVDSQTATANVASQAVVIPSNATANADIIFESSPDLINWTAAVAGSYASTTPNRFFRVRLVTH